MLKEEIYFPVAKSSLQRPPSVILGTKSPNFTFNGHWDIKIA